MLSWGSSADSGAGSEDVTATAGVAFPPLNVAHAPAARRDRLATFAAVGPCSAFLVLGFVIPIGYVLILSVTNPSVSLANYHQIIASPLYLRILRNTFTTSFLITVVCVLTGYPVSYVMARGYGVIPRLLLAVVAISFWTSFLVRTYAWLVILGNSGPIAAAYKLLNLGAMPQLLFTSFSSDLGMTQILLPYMILAIYGVMRRIEPNYVRAAESLGAPPFTSFRLVYFPLTLPGVASGAILVFTLCLGFYVTPILLGTPRDMMISQLIDQQVEELLNWGFAAAIAVVLLVATMVVLAVYDRFLGLDRLWG